MLLRLNEAITVLKEACQCCALKCIVSGFTLSRAIILVVTECTNFVVFMHLALLMYSRFLCTHYAYALCPYAIVCMHVGVFSYRVPMNDQQVDPAVTEVSHDHAGA